MGELVLRGVAADIIAKNAVDASDVLQLRHEVYKDGIVDRGAAEVLFAIDNSCKVRSDEWELFFLEAVTDYVVRQEPPVGHVSDSNASWLIDAISRDGVVCSRTELELLIKTMEVAKSMPAAFSAFALRQVALVVTEGCGPLAGGRTAKPGVVTADDVAMLRRILYAFGGAGQAGITREEAEVLFDINDHTIEAENDPSWSDLFVKAIGFSLMAATRQVMADRETALERQQWLDDDSVDVASFFSRVFAGGLRGYVDNVKSETGLEAAYRAANDAFEAANEAAVVIEKGEADWIAQRIGRDGVLHDNEKALLRFIKDESPDIHPSLLPLIDAVA